MRTNAEARPATSAQRSAVKSAAKKGWKPPANIMAMPDLSRVINSDEIQSAINPPKEGTPRASSWLQAM